MTDSQEGFYFKYSTPDREPVEVLVSVVPGDNEVSLTARFQNLFNPALELMSVPGFELVFRNQFTGE